MTYIGFNPIYQGIIVNYNLQDISPFYSSLDGADVEHHRQLYLIKEPEEDGVVHRTRASG